jgi:uncharacterized protein DUF5919
LASSEKQTNLIDLRSRLDYKPDAAGLARERLSSARTRINLSQAEFAKALAPLIGFTPPPEAIDSWETTTVAPGDVLVAAEIIASDAPGDAILPGETPDTVARLLSERFSDVVAVYATRSEFISRVPIQDLLDGASVVRASGLSLNLICQQYGDRRLHQLIEHGAEAWCLFLDPTGTSIRQREEEEGYSPGALTSLTQMNIESLNRRVRDRMPEASQDRLRIAVYNETIRFNIVLIDDQVCIVQPYLPGIRGIDSPTFVIQNTLASGLFSMFTEVFKWLWERGQPWN